MLAAIAIALSSSLSFFDLASKGLFEALHRVVDHADQCTVGIAGVLVERRLVPLTAETGSICGDVVVSTVQSVGPLLVPVSGGHVVLLGTLKR